jgi:class 3 adenylate cyclase/tetratricopeptide (TPR) repeat protein
MALTSTCHSCGHANVPGARYCAQCGSALAYVARAAATSASSEGELKQITVLFADVAGSTALIESLDPEEASRRLAPAIDAMKEAVQRFEGSVVRVQGDGIMAFFGAPNPQEDHAVRACCAALAMQAAVKAPREASLQVRVGIHSGEVLARTVETDFSTDFDASGVTVHIANRLERLAPEGSIAISAATMRGARPFVSTTSFGRHAIRGLSAPMEVFLLSSLRRGPTSERFASELGRSDFLGRDGELGLLDRALERAADGEGCAVGLVAEAGVGKSRLCFEFAERCRTRGTVVLEGRALAHSRATPYVPVIDIVKSYCSIAHDDPPELARDKVAARLTSVDPQLDAELPLMLDFLGLVESEAERPKHDPTVRRERMNGLFRRLIRSAGMAAPAVIVLEDLHLMDSGSESLIEVLVEALPGTKLLLVVNYRPGYAAPWMHVDYFDQISLVPLRPSAANSLAARLLGSDASVLPMLPLIADRARGNPLFVEELVRKFAESGHLAGELGAYRLLRAPDMRLVPDTVQAIIGARIDSRPEAEKSILQTAAVIGREFAVPILARLVGGLVEKLAGALHRLSAAGLVYETGGSHETVFAFKHPMVQDVAYRSLVSNRRRALHASVASELEETLPDPNGAQASFIAYHWEEAANPMQAASYNMKAANWHGTRDPAQALDAWKRVRRLLMGLPLEDQARYPLLVANGQIVNLAWREGVTAADAAIYYNDALEIARSLGDMRAVILLTAAYGRVLAASGSTVDYVATVSDVMSQLRDKHDASLKVVVTAILCHALRLAGDLARALEANDRALTRVHEVTQSDQQTLGFNVPVWIKGMRGQILSMMGRFDEARPLLDELIAGDEATVDVLHRLLAHAAHVDIAWGLDDSKLASLHSEHVMRLAEKSGNPYLLVYGRGYVGLAQAMRGEYADATVTLSEALLYARRRNAGLENEARLLADLAHVQMRAGLRDRGRATAEEAAAVARRRGAKVWQAYSEWLVGGPDSPAFKDLVEATGAELLRGLPHSTVRAGHE